MPSLPPGNADCIINGHSSDGGPGAGLTLLNVVIRKSVTIFQLPACKDESLLGGVKDALFMLDLSLHILDNTGLHL